MIDLSCAQCRERLPFSVAGQLASAERAEVARHLATCASCRAVLRQWMVIQQALRLDDAGAPPDTSAEQVWEGIWRRLPNTPREIGAWRNARSPQLTTIEREDEEMQPDEIDARQAGSSVATRPAQMFCGCA